MIEVKRLEFPGDVRVKVSVSPANEKEFFSASDDRCFTVGENLVARWSYVGGFISDKVYDLGIWVESEQAYQVIARVNIWDPKDLKT